MARRSARMNLSCDRLGGATGAEQYAVLVVRAEAIATCRLSVHPEVPQRVGLDPRTRVLSTLLQLDGSRTGARAHAAPDAHAAAARLDDDREPVGGIRGLLAARCEAQP